MPNDGRRIYIDTTVTPHKGIDVRRDVGHVLRTFSGNIGVNCTSNKINPWAKYKPTLYFGNVQTGKHVPTSEYWRAADGACGFDINGAREFGDPANANSFSHRLLAGSLVWTYVHPTGQPNYPYRNNDFDGYDHEAQSPFTPAQGVEELVVDSRGELHIGLDIESDPDSDWLNLGDFTFDGVALSSYYIGAILSYGNLSEVVATSRISDQGADDIVFEGMNSWRGRTGVKLAFFFSKAAIQQTSGTGVDPGYFVPYDIPPLTVSIASSAVTDYIVDVTAEWNGAETAIVVSINVQNNGSGQRYFSGSVYVYKDGELAPGTTTAFELTVNASATNSVTKTISITKLLNSEYEVYVTGFAETIITQVDEDNQPE